MKITVTDEFLWDIYKLLEIAKDASSVVLRPYPTMKNSLPGPKNPIFEKYRKEKSKRNFSNLIYYLKRKGYIKIKSLESKQALILTKRGIDKALRVSFRAEGMKKRKDGKWIMIIFDIPVLNRRHRNLMRSILLNLGYKLLQQSVWVTPYDVLEKTEKLIQMHSLDRYVKIFLIEKL